MCGTRLLAMRSLVPLLLLFWFAPWKNAQGGAWVDLFGQPTITGQIESVVRHDGLLYVSGSIFSVAGRRTRGLAVLQEATGHWVPVPLALDGGFQHMRSFTRGADNAVYAAGSCCGDKLIRLVGDQLTEVDLGGPITGMVVAQSASGPELIVTGRFGGSVFAIWDGASWRFVSALASSAVSPTVVRTGGNEEVYALSSGFSGQVLRLNEDRTAASVIAGFGRATALGELDGDLVACEQDFQFAAFGVFDGLTWSYPLIHTACEQMAQLPHPTGERLMIRSRGASWVSLGELGEPLSPPVLPTNGALFKDVRLPDALAAIFSPFRRQSQQLAIWERGDWHYPERSYESDKPQLDILSIHDNGESQHVFGRFYERDQLSYLGVAPFTDDGVGPAMRLPDFTLSAVVAQDGTIYAGLEEGLWISRGGEQRLLQTPVSVRSLAQLGDSPLYVSGCGPNLYRLNTDDTLSIAATMTDWSIQCDDALHLAGPPSSPQLYVVGNQFTQVSVPTQFFSIFSLTQSQLENITPPDYADAQRPSAGRLQPAVSEYDGVRQLMFGGGDTVYRHDGQSWSQLPPSPMGSPGGQAVSVEHAGRQCVYAAGGRQVQRYCEGFWDAPDELTFDSTVLQTVYSNTQFFLAISPARYNGRPVLLMGGLFESAGNSIQSRSGVFDLDVISESGFEF